jgi:hypothetical protein
MEVLKVNAIWYHGSPYELSAIRKGSTITQNKDLARVFSHKPPCVSIDDQGNIKHNGNIEGYLYQIDEGIGEDDVYLHPRTTMEKGLEWLTNKELKVRLIEKTYVRDDEKLSAEEINEIKRLSTKK